MPADFVIPVDVHLVTVFVTETRIEIREVSVGRTTQQRRERVTVETDVPSEVSPQDVTIAFRQANEILQSTGIEFRVRSCEPRRATAPANQRRVDDAGFFALAREFPPRQGVSMFVVRDFHDRDLGGSAVAAQRICIVKKLGNPSFGHVLAHEFGHLLSLSHVAARDDTDVDNFNLMYPGLRAGHRITARQRNDARGSALATAFPRRAASP